MLPNNIQAAAGKALGNNNKLWVGGTRLVKFDCNYRAYEIPLSRVVAHEIGHCLGLQHTNTDQYGNGDGDGLSDTPLDFSDKDECVNPNNCQFAGIQPGGCNAPCNTASNPQTPTFTNVMAGATLPQCMTQFSPMQVMIMKNNLGGPMNYVVDNAATVATEPDVQNMNYKTAGSTQPPQFLYTYNAIPPNTWYNIQSNINLALLSGPISWNPNTSVNAFASGSNNTTYNLNLSSGQSVNVAINATNECGTANRTVTFAVYSGYRVYPNPAKSTVYIEFDNVEQAALLPEDIRLFSEKSTNPVYQANVQDVYNQKAFKDKNQIELDVKNLARGTYYLHINNSKRKEKETDIIRLLLE